MASSEQRTGTHPAGRRVAPKKAAPRARKAAEKPPVPTFEAGGAPEPLEAPQGLPEASGGAGDLAGSVDPVEHPASASGPDVAAPEGPGGPVPDAPVVPRVPDPEQPPPGAPAIAAAAPQLASPAPGTPAAAEIASAAATEARVAPVIAQGTFVVYEAPRGQAKLILRLENGAVVEQDVPAVIAGIMFRGEEAPTSTLGKMALLKDLVLGA